jgi:HSP20 family protein
MVPALPNGRSLRDSVAPVNRLLETFFGGDDFFEPRANARSALPMSTWEDENHIYIEIDAPGVVESDVDVSMHGDELAICVERKQEQKSVGFDSRRYGRFEQRMTLPSAVDAERVEATLNGGVLRVTLPKSEQAKPRKITVRSQAQ